MKKLLSILFTFAALGAFSQGAYKDTVIAGWVVRCRLGTTGEGIFGSPGAGQVGNGVLGHDTVFMNQFGPEFFIKNNGWDASVTLGNGVHHPSIFTLIQPGSSGFTPASQMKPVIDGILASRFAPSKGRANLSWWGFSAGGWLGCMFNATTFSSTSDTSFFNYFTTMIDLQGVISNDNSGATIPYPQRFGHRAAVKKFRYLGIEGTFDESRDIWGRRDNINDSAAGSAFGIWTTDGGGAHCCWNDYMNPTFNNFTSTNSLFLTLHDGATSNFPPGNQNIWQWALRNADTAMGTTPPTVVAGNYSVTQANGYDLMLTPTVTGNNLKYSWAWSGYYTGNDKVTHATSTANSGDPRVLAIKGPFQQNPQVIQMALYEGDSIHVYKIGVTVTDSVTGLFARDTATITFRYWNRYPPQNVDGSPATHLCTMADSVSFGCSIFYQDVIITGANQDPIKDASGNIQFTSFLALSTFSDSFHIAQKGRASRIYIHTNGNPYFNFKIACDTIGGRLWQPIGVADTLASHQILMTAYGPGRLTCTGGWYFANMRNWKFSGKYDPANGLGDINYQGPFGPTMAYTDTLYKIGADNNYSSIAGHGIQIDGKDTYAAELECFSSIRGNFDGIDAKVESNSILNGATRLLFWDYLKIHDCLVIGAHGENYYIGSANPPAVQLRHIRVYNNRSAFSGNKLLKTLDLYDDCLVYNNVGFNGSIDFPSPFELNVSVGQEASFTKDGSKLYNNLMYGFGNQGLNLITQIVTTPAGDDSVTNNFYGHGVGPIGAFGGQQDSAFSIKLTNNYFGLHGPFLFGSVYSGGAAGRNTNTQFLALPAGNVPNGTRSTYKFRGSIYDSTKFNLTGGDATFDTASDLRISLLTVPLFKETGFENVALAIQMVDTVYGMWGDENHLQTSDSARQGTPFSYSIGQVVKWFDKFYISRINNNTFFPTFVTDANWMLMTFSNGGTTPPNDFRLISTSLYALKGIGLLQQFVIPPNTNPFLIRHRYYKKRFLN